MEKYPTPIETLMKFKGQEITVELRSKEKVQGELIAFDLNTNLTLNTSEGTRFIQGSSVNFIYGQEDEVTAEEPTEEEAEPEATEEKAPTEETAEPKEAEETETTEEAKEPAEEKAEPEVKKESPVEETKVAEEVSKKAE